MTQRFQVEELLSGFRGRGEPHTDQENSYVSERALLSSRTRRFSREAALQIGWFREPADLPSEEL